MVKGILFLETGEVQIIGLFNSAANIIAAIKTVLPDLEEQEKQRQLELAEKQRVENLYTPAEIKILENLTDYDKEYLNRFTGETRERVEKGLIREYQKEIKYQEKLGSPEYKKRRADRNAR